MYYSMCLGPLADGSITGEITLTPGALFDYENANPVTDRNFAITLT